MISQPFEHYILSWTTLYLHNQKAKPLDIAKCRVLLAVCLKNNYFYKKNTLLQLIQHKDYLRCFNAISLVIYELLVFLHLTLLMSVSPANALTFASLDDETDKHL